jgi:hypothetical protein
VTIRVGDTFRCITHSLYTVNKEDELTVYQVDYIGNQVEVRLHKNGQHVYVPLATFPDYFIHWEASLDSLMGYGLTPSLCECGIEKTFKDYDTTYMHSDYCVKYKKPDRNK